MRECNVRAVLENYLLNYRPHKLDQILQKTHHLRITGIGGGHRINKCLLPWNGFRQCPIAATSNSENLGQGYGKCENAKTHTQRRTYGQLPPPPDLKRKTHVFTVPRFYSGLQS